MQLFKDLILFLAVERKLFFSHVERNFLIARNYRKLFECRSHASHVGRITTLLKNLRNLHFINKVSSSKRKKDFPIEISFKRRKIPQKSLLKKKIGFESNEAFEIRIAAASFRSERSDTKSLFRRQPLEGSNKVFILKRV